MGENRFARYELAEGVYLADAAGERYVAIEPTGMGVAVEHGRLGPGGDGEQHREPAGAPATFPPDALAAAVQRVCALAADYLGFDEWDVEQTRQLFAETPQSGARVAGHRSEHRPPMLRHAELAEESVFSGDATDSSASSA